MFSIVTSSGFVKKGADQASMFYPLTEFSPLRAEKTLHFPFSQVSTVRYHLFYH